MAKQTKGSAKAAKVVKVAKSSEKSVEEIEADLQLPASSDDEELSVEEGSDVSGEELSEESDNGEDDDEDSEQQDDEAEEEEVEIKIPEITHKVTKAKSNASNTKSNKATKGVIYLGRIPHGFQEAEMTKYFTQFGDITRLRLSRNKKTGKSKHYGFVEFQEQEVAKIAAETMNNYLLFGHLLKCHVVPKEDVHDDLFKGASTTFKSIPWAKVSKHKHDSAKTQKQWERLQKKHEQRQKSKKDSLKAKGIDFDLSSIV